MPIKLLVVMVSTELVSQQATPHLPQVHFEETVLGVKLAMKN